jgi:hypothetical protein
MKLEAGESSEQYAEGAKSPFVNPEWYGYIGSTPMTKTRVSFHKKRGACTVYVLDRDNSDTPFLLTDENGDTGYGITYQHNDNWEAASYTVTFEHGSSTSIKLKFENIDSTNECYIDAVIIEPDWTGKRPSFYTDGAYSISAENIGDINNYVTGSTPTQGIYEQDDEPTEAEEKDLWIDTNDYSRYDVQIISGNTAIVAGSPESIVIKNTASTIFLTFPSYAISEGCVFLIQNESNYLAVLYLANILNNDDASFVLYPKESIQVISDSTKWSIL